MMNQIESSTGSRSTNCSNYTTDDNRITYAEDEPILVDLPPPDEGEVERQNNKLPLSQRLAFSVGHVLNDLCSAMWFTYLLVYFEGIRGFSSSNAGIALLLGQVADAMATPFVGLESDRVNFSMCNSYGKRKSWHLFGTICVAISFPLIFTECVGCNSYTSQFAQLIYYSAFIIIFQFGWAAVQISHLSLIPELTPVSSERTELNSYVYAWTVSSNIAVYSIMWFLFGLDKTRNPSITKKDGQHFHHLVLIVVTIGLTCSIVFHLLLKETTRASPSKRHSSPSVAKGIRNSSSSSGVGDDEKLVQVEDEKGERKRKRKKKEDEEDGDEDEGASSSFARRRSHSISLASVDYSLPCNHIKWHQWFTVSQFYKVSLMYLATRMCINLTQAYIPFYLQKTLNMNAEAIAYIPLSMYLSGFLSSFLIKYINGRIGKKLTYLMGALIAIAAFSWMYFGSTADEDSSSSPSGKFFRQTGIYIVSVIIGVSSSTMLITSLAITNDLIGHNTSSGAFVFGAMSFLDKLSNGAAVMIVQGIHDNSHPSMGCSNFYRNVVAFACGGAALASLVALGLLSREKIGKVTRTPKRDQVPSPHASESGPQGQSAPETGERQRALLARAATTGDTGKDGKRNLRALKGDKQSRQSDVSSLARGKGCRPLLGPKCSDGRSFVEYGATNESNNGGRPTTIFTISRNSIPSSSSSSGAVRETSTSPPIATHSTSTCYEDHHHQQQQYKNDDGPNLGAIKRGGAKYK